MENGEQLQVDDIIRIVNSKHYAQQQNTQENIESTIPNKSTSLKQKLYRAYLLLCVGFISYAAYDNIKSKKHQKINNLVIDYSIESLADTDNFGSYFEEYYGSDLDDEKK